MTKVFEKITAVVRNQKGVSPIALSFIVSTYIMAAFNKTFWTTGYQLFEGNWLELLVFGGAVFGLTLFLTSFVTSKWIQKPALIALLIIGSVSSYYMDNLGVMIDRDMIQNAVTTTVREAKHLITFNFISYVLLYGGVPSVLIVLVKINRPKFLRALITQVLFIPFTVALCLGLLLTNLQTYSVILRNSKELMGSYQPGAPLAGALRYAEMMMKSAQVELKKIGEDAVKGPLITAAKKPVLTVIMIGETARAQNFSITGYERKTTPELEQIPDVIAFEDVYSCGTATAVSMPCMFSKFDRAAYTYEKGIGNENLLDVLTYAGLDVEWWENNTGDKQIANRVTKKNMTYLEDPVFCAVGECDDGIFGAFLQEKLDTITKDTVIVMHQIGSHGPAYYLRYPDAYRRFTPTCDTSELKNCTVPEILNTYDNTIAYTDHILANTIKMLDNQDRVATAMVYLSDHGESMGEKGLFLHGAPYFMAPEYQIKVPFILWFSQEYREVFGTDLDCLGKRAKETASHANFFHSMLGLMNIDTTERNDDLDVISNCRSGDGT